MDRAPVRPRDFPSAVLLTLILLIASQRLYATNWTSGLGTVLLLTLLGTMLGLAFGSSKFNRLAVFFLGLGYSIVFLPLVTGLNLYRNTAWPERLAGLGGQLADSFIQLITGQPVRNSTLFIFFASVVFWVISLVAGYTLTRFGGFARAIVPAGVVLIIIQLFDMRVGDHAYILAVYAFLCLLLLGRLTYIRKLRLWKDQHVWVSAESVTDLNIIFGMAALALVIFAWAAPASNQPVPAARIVWQNLTRPWREKQQELNRTVESLQGNQVQTVEFYSDTLALGRQAQTGSDAYLHIRVPLIHGAAHYYWRVRSYDLYRDNQWYTSYIFDEPFTPGQRSLSLADPEGITGEFVFTSSSDNLGLLVTPPRPVWVSRSSQLTFTPAAEGRIDPLMFLANPPVLVGEQYIVHANIYEPTVTQLRNAGVNYPAWVSEHYLQLPADLPPEIPNLARQITLGAGTPYDQAAAITAYLRANITYSASVGTPPAGRDPLVWFLFDAKKGFCNYYATAEVVLLRSIGIPARMVVGFAQGEYQPPNQYTVRQQDAHAWPEVYFPGNGWIEFEPTSSQPPLVRPGGDNASNSQATPTPQTTPQANAAQQTPVPFGEGGAGSGTPPNSLLRLVLILLVASVLVVAGFVAYIFGALDKFLWAARRTFQKPLPVLLKNSLEELSLVPPDWLVRWAYFAGLAPTERSFAVVYRSLRWLGVRTSPAQTPAEAAAMLSGHMPGVSGEIRSLLHEYQHSLYSQDPGDLHVARHAAEVIQHASMRAALLQRWRAFGGIFRRGFQQWKH